MPTSPAEGPATPLLGEEKVLSMPDLSSWTRYERSVWQLFLWSKGRPRALAAISGGALLALVWLLRWRSLAVAAGLIGSAPGLVWGSLMMARLPTPRGTHGAGSLDLEVDVPGTSESMPRKLKVRLYYPASNSGKSRDFWLPEPRRAYLQAFGDLYGVGGSKGQALLSGMLRLRSHSVAGASPQGTGWPVVIFSHGLCSTRTTYSALCTELASRGYLVAVPEHGDHSAALAVTTEQTINYVGFSGMTSAGRQAQLRQRAKELVACWRALSRLDEGLVTAALLDLSSCALIGHSFGGATALVACGEPELSVGAVVMLDPWLRPTKGLHQPASAPVLAVMTGSMLYDENARDVVEALHVAKDKSILAELVDSRHFDQSDISFMLRWPMSFLGSTSMLKRPKVLFDSNADCILKFLHQRRDGKSSFDDHGLDRVPGIRVHDFQAWYT